MSGPEGRIECTSCRELIQRGAMKCPHCRTLQSRWVTWSIRLAPFAVALFPVILVALVVRREFRNPYDFASARDRLAIVQSTSHYSEANEKCGATISVVGTIRNKGDIPVKDVFVEVRYFDAAGALIDAEGAEQYSMVIPPAGEVAFRLSSRAIRAPSDYAAHRVTIVSVKDARSAF